MRQPKGGRPVTPSEYGIAKGVEGLAPWTHVEERLSSSRNYWVSTTTGCRQPGRTDGRACCRCGGVWMEGVFYFCTDRRSRKGRNLAQQPAVAVHLESGDEVVILEGVADQVMDGPAAGGL